MQSGRGKLKKWVLEFDTKDPSINPLMGWQSSADTKRQVRMYFPDREAAIAYAEAHHIVYDVDEPNIRRFRPRQAC